MGEVRCPVLVGRDAELAALQVAVEGAAAGNGQVVAVLGEAGVGKTRLAAAATELARSCRMTVLRGRAAASAAPSPYRPLVEAFTAALRGREPPPVPAGLARAVATYVPTWGAGDGLGPAQPSTVLMGEAALALLDAVDTGHGVLILLEDLHWTDPDTLDVVHYLTTELTDRATLVLVTLRSGAGEAQRWARSVAGRRGARLMELHRLDPDDTARVIAASLGTADPPESLVTEILRCCGGLPFLVEELLSALLGAGVIAPTGDRWVVRGELPTLVPPSFADLVADRLAGLPAPARSALEAAALLGERFDWRLVAASLAASDGEVTAALRRAVDAQLVEEDRGRHFRFRHALTATAVLETMLPPERASRADGALRALGELDDTTDPELLGLAAELAEIAGDDRRAVELFLATSKGALSRGAVASARTSAQRAARRAAATQHVVDAQRAALEAGAAAGDALGVLDTGEHLLARLEALAAPATDRADIHRRLASAAVAATAWSRAGAHLDAAETLDPTPVPAERAGAAILRAELALGEHRSDDALAHACAAAQTAAGAALPDLEADAFTLLGRATRLVDLRLAEQHFTAALARAELSGSQLRRARVLHELGTIDVIRTGETQRVRRAGRLAADIGAPGLAAAADLQLAVLSWKRFELDDARAAATRAREAGQRHGLGLLVPLAVVLEGDVDAVLGHHDEAVAAFERARPDMDPEIEASGRGNLLAVAALAVEDRDVARDELARAASLAPAGSASARSPYQGLRALVLALDRAPNAVTLTAELTSTPILDTVGRSFGELADAVLIGRAGEPADATVAFATADTRLDAAPWWQALGRRLVAEAAIDDRWGTPAVWLRDALAFFDDAGIAHPARACRSLLRRTGAAVPRADGLGVPPELAVLGVTIREADVLALLVEGLANREIAERLYLSPRTVEKHIERLLTKTSTTRRAQLTALATRLHAEGTR